MWKIAVASMLLATTAFGAVDLTVNPNGNVTANAARQVVLDIGLAITGGSTVNGIGIYPVTDAVGAVSVASRVANNSVLTDPTASSVTGVVLDNSGAIDLGYTAAVGASTGATGSVETLTLQLAPGVNPTLANPIEITFYGVWSGPNGQGGGDNLDIFKIVNITPEPTSMLLLAAGSLLFARRRRA